MSKEAQQTTPGVSPEVAEKIKELAALVARERFGPDGRPPLETTFSTIEEIGHQVGRHLATEVDAELTERHREHFVAPQPCPQCSRLCAPGRGTHDVTTRDGPTAVPEVRCHCPACRRDFFPSEGPVATRGPRV